MDDLIKTTLAMLGQSGKDKVTSFEGTITSACFDVYGCVQVVLTPQAIDGKLADAHWFDVKRIELVNDYATGKPRRVFPAPYFTGDSPRRPGDEPGGDAHPPFPSMPVR